MRKIAFETHAFQDFTEWATSDKKRYRRIIHLITDILRHLNCGFEQDDTNSIWVTLRYQLGNHSPKYDYH